MSYPEVLIEDLPPHVAVAEEEDLLVHQLHVVDGLDDGAERGDDPAGVSSEPGRLPHPLRTVTAAAQTRELLLRLREPVK